MFKYNLLQKVKVSLNKFVTEGFIVKCESYGQDTRYEVYVEAFNKYVYVWEYKLDFVQNMNVGDIVD